jgi:integrase
VLEQVGAESRLATRLLYGGGLRSGEAVRLRIKDLDFDARKLVIRDEKGARDRITVMPESLRTELLDRVELTRARSAANGQTARPVGVPLPGALASKKPSAPFEIGWQWVFPSRSIDRSMPERPLR